MSYPQNQPAKSIVASNNNFKQNNSNGIHHNVQKQMKPHLPTPHQVKPKFNDFEYIKSKWIENDAALVKILSDIGSSIAKVSMSQDPNKSNILNELIRYRNLISYFIDCHTSFHIGRIPSEEINPQKRPAESEPETITQKPKKITSFNLFPETETPLKEKPKMINMKVTPHPVSKKNMSKIQLDNQFDHERFVSLLNSSSVVPQTPLKDVTFTPASTPATVMKEKEALIATPKSKSKRKSISKTDDAPQLIVEPVFEKSMEKPREEPTDKNAEETTQVITNEIVTIVNEKENSNEKFPVEEKKTPKRTRTITKKTINLSKDQAPVPENTKQGLTETPLTIQTSLEDLENNENALKNIETNLQVPDTESAQKRGQRTRGSRAGKKNKEVIAE